MRRLIIALFSLLAATGCQSRTTTEQQRDQATLPRTDDRARFNKTTYMSLLTEMDHSPDPATKAAVTVLRSGRDVSVPNELYGPASNVLARIGVMMPVGDRDLLAEEKDDWIRRCFQTLYQLDTALNGMPLSSRASGLEPTEALVVAEALAAAQFADVRGSRPVFSAGKPNAVDEMIRVIERHGYSADHARRGDIEFSVGFLDALLIYSTPPPNTPERQLFQDLIRALGRLTEERPTYTQKRDQLARALLHRYLVGERQRWPGLMPPPIWYLKEFEWERFDIPWDGSGTLR